MNDKIIIELKSTKDHFELLEKNVVVDNPALKDTIDCVIYQDYKTLSSDGTYSPVPMNEKKVHVMSKSDFLSNFELCLDF